MGEPTVFTIPPGTAFVDALAAGIRNRHGGDPLAAARVTVLLPTRRACRALREAFLRAGGGKPALLPAMRPLGEVEADELALQPADGDWEGAGALDAPPAISPVRRRLLLAQLILRVEASRREDGAQAMAADQALVLAAELVAFLDQMQIEEVPFDRLRGIAPENLAHHWQQTLEFLRILAEHWPGVLAEDGVIDPMERRRRLMDAQAAAWERKPPPVPVIAAGSTGTVPATARLLGVVARLPQGCVMLPGLDTTMADAVWDAIDAGHPQHSMRHLLHQIGVERSEVTAWPEAGTGRPERAALLAQAMRPPQAWAGAPAKVPAAAVAGISRLDCPGQEEEARAVALVLRGALETLGKTAALVTPDRGLARRVAAELMQWDIAVDDSAGVPLGLSPVGSFLRLTAAVAVEEAAPVPLLAALKHPLASGGVRPPRFRERVRRLEYLVLRGPRPAPGFEGLRQALAAVAGEAERPRTAGRAAALLPWLDAIAAAAAPLAEAAASEEAGLGALLRSHFAFAEALAADHTGRGARRLWGAADGEAAAVWAEEVLRSADSAPPLDGRRYPAVLAELMAGVTVRPLFVQHPRLHIWGPLEARLQQADVVVLGSCNEGTWPPQARSDPWLSRPMRAAAGLPAPERRTGLAAHDFAQLAAAPEVVLTRSTKVEGSPTVPSRWLVRLETVLKGAGAELPEAPWFHWQALLHEPDAVVPVAPPAPAPPVEARPKALSATRIGDWVRDPYQVYARYVLRLRKLDDLDETPGAAERGSIVHNAVDRFLKAVGAALPADAEEVFLREGREAFGATLQRPGVWAFWWPRFARIAAWFVRNEHERREAAALAGSEVVGRTQLGGFTVSAKADRIDRFRAGGGLAVVDYKTGTLPQVQEMDLGYAPQLAVEAVIAEAGGFEGVAAAAVRELAYWRLTGRGDGGEVRAYLQNRKSQIEGTAALVRSTREGLEQLIAAFADPATPYRSRPRPDFGPQFSDYDHLARVQEWSAGADTEEMDKWVRPPR